MFVGKDIDAIRSELRVGIAALAREVGQAALESIGGAVIERCSYREAG